MKNIIDRGTKTRCKDAHSARPRRPGEAGLMLAGLLLLGILQACSLVTLPTGKMATLNLQFAATSRGTSLPVLQASDISSYDINLENGTQTINMPGVTDLSVPVPLDPGTWNLTMAARDASGILIGNLQDLSDSDNQLTVEINAGANQVPVTLVPVLARTASGTGSVDLAVSWDAPSPVISFEVSWYAWDPMAKDFDFAAGVVLDPASQAVPDLPGTGVHILMPGVASGDYVAVFRLTSVWGSYNAVSQLVKVYDNLTTRDTVAVNQNQLTEAPSAPANLQVGRVSWSNGSPVELVLNWSAPSTGNTANYHIYIDGVLVASPAATYMGTQAWTWTGGGGSAATLEVRAFNAAGESPAASLGYVPLSSLSLADRTMKTGDVLMPVLNFVPANANPVVRQGSWYSSNPAVAAVDYSTGQVTALSSGTATIYVQTINDLNNDGSVDTASFTVTVTASLVGSWDFEGTPAATNNTGIAEVVMSPAPMPSSPGYASSTGIMFAGTGTPKINLAAPYNTMPAPWSLSLWVKPDSGHSMSSEALLSYDTTSNGGASNGSSFKLKQFNGSDQVGITIYGEGDYVFSGVVVAESAWSHLVFVNDGTAVSLWVNGVNRGSLTQASVVALPLPQGILGALSLDGGNTASDRYYGGMDNLNIYTVALDAAAVTGLGNVAFGGGNGTSGSPYVVDTAQRLDNVRYFPSAWFVQTANIVHSGFAPIGSSTIPFAGNYDGGGYSVTGLALYPSVDDSYGLFGAASGATISNLIVQGTISSSAITSSGLLAGAISSSTINNCAVSGTISATNADSSSQGSLGMLVGKASNSLISNCTASGTIYDPSSSDLVRGKVGGLVGSVVGGKISQCTASTSLDAGLHSGGLVGHLTAGSLLVDTYYGAVIEKCAATGAVSAALATNSNAGGLVGTALDGLGASFADAVLIKESYSTGAVTAMRSAGGFIGYISNYYQVNGVTVTNSYSTGTASLCASSDSASYAGGFVGYIYQNTNHANLNYCLAGGSASLTGAGTANGFLGAHTDTVAQFTNCLYNSDKGNADANVNVTGAMTALMMTQSYWTGRGFDIDASASATSTTWIIQEGISLPYLRWQGSNNVPSTPFALRDFGPGGGYVFYDKGSYSSGWRYLVAGPADIQGSSDGTNYSLWVPMAYGGQNGVDVTSTGPAVGDGPANTTAIAGVRSGGSNIDTAAQACENYSLTAAGKTYINWFLPSLGELNLIWSQLFYNGYGSFTFNASYWSSTDTEDDDCTWAVFFQDGTSASNPNWHTQGYRVRPVMQF